MKKILSATFALFMLLGAIIIPVYAERTRQFEIVDIDTFYPYLEEKAQEVTNEDAAAFIRDWAVGHAFNFDPRRISGSMHLQVFSSDPINYAVWDYVKPLAVWNIIPEYLLVCDKEAIEV